MSGIYIPGMKLPENCFLCPAHEWFDFGGKNHGYQCPILRTTTCISNCEARTKRRDNCPMIPVPPHGRLGDLDRLERMFADIDHAPYSGFDGEEAFYSAEDAARIIRLAPTIIPTDKENLL